MDLCGHPSKYALHKIIQFEGGNWIGSRNSSVVSLCFHGDETEVFEDDVFRKTFGPMSDEAFGKFKVIRNRELCG